MPFSSRLKGDRGSNVSFEALIPAIADLESAVDTLKTQMAAANSNASTSLTAPAPAIPFKIGERSDNDGIYVSVAVLVPTATQVLRIQIIRTIDNQKKSSDTTDVAAVKRANRQLLKFELQVSEQEAQDGVVEREIGPLKPKKSSADQSYQLIRLIALDDNGAKAKNPAISPLSPTGPFTTGATLFSPFVIDTGGINFFTVGNSVSLPPKVPVIGDIICNQVETGGQVSTAKVTVRVWANADLTKTFADVGATDVYAVFKLQNDTAIQTVMGATGEVDNRLKFGGPLEDPTVNFVLIDAVLTFGSQYEFKKVITQNASGKQVSVGSNVFFVGGKGVTVASLTGTTLVAVPRDSHHTMLTLTFTQPGASSECDNPAVYIKRIEYGVKEDADSDYILDKKYTALDEEMYAIAGTTTTLVQKIKHKANQSFLSFRARIVGVGRNPVGAGNIKDVVSTGSSTSTFNTPPATPIAADIISNIPDDDTESNDAVTVFRVYASTDKTSSFRQVGADGAYIVLRRKKAGSGTAGDDTEADAALPRYGGPIDPGDLDSASLNITVRQLKLGRRYLFVRAITTSQGSPAKGGAGNIAFIAGLGTVTNDAQDITRLDFADFVPLEIIRINKHHSSVRLSFAQPATPDAMGKPVAPVLLKNARIFQRIPTNAEGGSTTPFTEVGSMVLKEDPEISTQTDINKTIAFTVQHPINSAGIQYYVELRAIGNDIEYIGQNASHTFAGLIPFTDGNTGGGLTGLGPSPPLLAYLTNTITGTDKNDGRAILRVYAEYSNVAPVGPTSSTFQQVGADEVTVVLRRKVEDASLTDPLKFGGSLTDTQLTSSFVDISCDGLKVGKTYEWTKNVLKTVDGFKQVNIGAGATGTPLPFVAGNFGSGAIPIPTIAVTPQDSRHSLITVSFTQSASPVYVRKLKLLASQSAVPNDTLHVIDREDLIDGTSADNTSYNSSGTKVVNFVVKHKAPPNIVTYRAALLSVASDTPANSTPDTTEVVGNADDQGAPQYAGNDDTLARIKIRWKDKHLKFKFIKPSINMTSFDKTKVRFTIRNLSDGSVYVWNPDDGSFNLSFGTEPLDDNLIYNDITYTADLFGATTDSFPADRPSTTAGKGVEFPQGAFDHLVSNSTFLQVDFYIYNQFSGPGGTYKKLTGKLTYTPSDPLVWPQQ